MDLETHFDVILLGTGLTESIIAAALSKAGFRIAHIDENTYYGADEANLSLDELIKWADDRTIFSPDETPTSYVAAQRSRFTHISRSVAQLPQPQQYSLSLCPAVIPAIGPLISSLVSSGVARYGGFRLIEQVGIYRSNGKIMHVPGSKEDIFKNRDLSLLDKRRLMRFLLFAVGQFEGSSELSGQEQTPFLQFLKNTFTLSDDLAQVIVYSLAYCSFPSDITLPALQRVRRYLLSAGRYGPSSFIIGHYGCAGEISQGFCRTSAVHGGVYILGKRILSIDEAADGAIQQGQLAGESHPARRILTLEDFPDKLSCDLIVSSQDYISPELMSAAAFVPSSEEQDYVIARCIAIIDQPLSFCHDEETSPNDPYPLRPTTSSHNMDNALLIFPPSSVVEGSSETSVMVLVTGESSMSAPKGKWILYFSMPILHNDDLSPEALIRPYLMATLSLTSRPLDGIAATPPLFTAFYAQRSSMDHLPTTSLEPNIVVTPPIPLSLPESLDFASTNAEAVFHKVVGILRTQKANNVHEDGEGLWPPLDDIDDEPENW